MTLFVKLLGSSDMVMSNEPFHNEEEINREIRFPKGPKPPDVAVGDELLYYAVGGYLRIFAVAVLTGLPVEDPNHTNPEVARRWPWAAPVEFNPATKLRRVFSGPLLSDVSPDLQRKIGHGVSHFEIGRADFDKAVALLRKAKAVEDAQLRREGALV